MMKFHILTLFPEMVQHGLATSILGRAAEKNLISIDAVNIRDYTQDKHGKVDDYTYGGGAGMLMQAQPVYDAYRSVAGEKKIRCVYLTPQGEPFTQKKAKELSGEEELVLLCGHYEGIDERVLEEVVTDYISIGDYVLTGGELAAMVVVDAVARLVPEVLNNNESAETESFHKRLAPGTVRATHRRTPSGSLCKISGKTAGHQKTFREETYFYSYDGDTVQRTGGSSLCRGEKCTDLSAGDWQCYAECGG